MGSHGNTENRRASTLALLTYLFVLLMAYALVVAYQGVFNFQKKAGLMTDAMKEAENFKRDYLLALYAPATSIKVCHALKQTVPCKVSIRAPEVLAASPVAVSVPADALGKYAPVLSVGMDDPPWNASVLLDVTTYTKTGLTEVDVIEPFISAEKCDTETIGAIKYKTCTFICTMPVRILKERVKNADVGGGTIIDKISVEQGAGLC